MAIARRVIFVVTLLLTFGLAPAPSHAMPPEVRNSVVSVLPVWPGRAQGGAGARPGVAPEGSGVVLAPGIIATAWHVIEPAERIDIRLSDGRILPARLVAMDVATDVAVLSIEAEVPPFVLAPRPNLADRACAIGNAWGLGLSVTCGVVSALDITEAGFNEVEHFVQTDAAANPGVSGGALVDGEGRLLGMMSAIFASEGETNIGVNFAVSSALLDRVVKALLEEGSVRYPDPGWRLARSDRAQLARLAAPVVASVEPDGAAARAGLEENDLVVAIEARRVMTPRDVVAALALLPEGTTSIEITIERAGVARSATLRLDTPEAAGHQALSDSKILGDCPHPKDVCRMRQVVFPVASFDPIGSATRIGQNLLVTNRHVVGNRRDAIVHTPEGPRDGRVLASAYTGDLALIEVEGLPETGFVPALEAAGRAAGQTYAIGADIARQEVRVFDPGTLISPPAEGAPLGRIHVTSRMQPGVSGGALVDETGALVGVNVGGGEGRYEAIPVADVLALMALTEDEEAETVTKRLGAALAECVEILDRIQPRQAGTVELEAMADICAEAENQGQLLEAGRAMAMAGAFDSAAALHGQAVAQVPNSINARVSLLVSLQLAARFEDMVPHARRVMELAPNDPQVLRFAIQSGVWGGAPELAEAGYAALLEADPRQAEAARRFIDNAPPAPTRR